MRNNISFHIFNKIINNLKCKHYSYGFRGKNTLSVVSYKFNLDHTDITLKYQKESFKIKTKLIGTFNISNILAATLCLIKLNFSISSIKETIESFKGAQRVNLWNNENSFDPVYPNDITIFKEI